MFLFQCSQSSSFSLMKSRSHDSKMWKNLTPDALSIANKQTVLSECRTYTHTMEFHTININIYACNRLFHTFFSFFLCFNVSIIAYFFLSFFATISAAVYNNNRNKNNNRVQWNFNLNLNNNKMHRWKIKLCSGSRKTKVHLQLVSKECIVFVRLWSTKNKRKSLEYKQLSGMLMFNALETKSTGWQMTLANSYKTTHQICWWCICV